MIPNRSFSSAHTPAVSIERDIAVLWRDSDVTICTLSWLGDRFRVRLVRDSRVIDEMRSADEQLLFAIAVQWEANHVCERNA
jgi:hypothetical protein